MNQTFFEMARTCKWYKLDEIILTENSRIGELIILYLRKYYKVIISKILWYWPENEQI